MPLAICKSYSKENLFLQNTPFATAKQAEEEFEKIFLAKSGNVWSERNRFEAKPKRYRLVDIEQV